MDLQDTRQRVLAGLLIVMALGFVGWQIMNWWTRPPAVEFDNLKYIRLLSTAVSSRNGEMVTKVETAIRQRFDEGQMSDQELQHFQGILTLVRDGQWEQADRRCFEFAEAQLGRSRAKPAGGEHAHDHSHDERPGSGK